MCLRENKNGGNKWLYTVTNTLRKRYPAFVVLLPYLQECSCYLGCIYYHNACGYQNWQGGDLPWGAPIRKVTRHFDHMVLRDHLTWQTKNISDSRVLMANKLGRMVTYLDGVLPIKSHETLIKFSCKITWHTKKCLFYHNTYGHHMGCFMTSYDKYYILTYVRPVTRQCHKVMTYGEGLHL